MSAANETDKRRGFLWSGTSGDRKDHLVSWWDRVCTPKVEGGLGLGCLVYNGFRDFVLLQNNWDTRINVVSTNANPWKFIDQVSPLFFPFVKYTVGNGLIVKFGRKLGKESILLQPSFLEFTNYRLCMRHLRQSRATFYSRAFYSGGSWDLHLWRHPLKWEVEEVSSLILVLKHVTVSHVDDTRVWIGDGSRIFTCKSFLEKINLPPRYPPFPVSNFIWKAKAPLKIWSFVWTLALGRINMNDMIQRGHSTMALSPNACVIC